MQWNQPLVEPEPPRFTGIDLCTRSDLCPWLHVSHPLGLVTSGRGSMSTASHPKIRFSQPASQTLCRSPAPLCAHSLVESAWFCGPTSESLLSVSEPTCRGAAGRPAEPAGGGHSSTKLCASDSGEVDAPSLCLADAY